MKKKEEEKNGSSQDMYVRSVFYDWDGYLTILSDAPAVSQDGLEDGIDLACLKSSNEQQPGC